MTTVQITDELLDELELHARQATCDAITDGFEYDPRIGLTDIEESFCVAASPATILALVEHIRSLEARLENAEKKAAEQPGTVKVPRELLERTLNLYWFGEGAEDCEIELRDLLTGGGKP